MMMMIFVCAKIKLFEQGTVVPSVTLNWIACMSTITWFWTWKSINFSAWINDFFPQLFYYIMTYLHVCVCVFYMFVLMFFRCFHSVSYWSANLTKFKLLYIYVCVSLYDCVDICCVFVCCWKINMVYLWLTTEWVYPCRLCFFFL